MIGTLPAGSFCVFPTIARPLEGLRAAERGWITDKQPSLALVHGDPTNRELPALLEELTAETSSFLVGGLTSSRNAQSQVADEITRGGVSGVLFAADVAVATGLSQGCTPIGPSHRISACRENILLELDGRPALEVFKEDVGSVMARGGSLSDGSFHAALPIPGSDTGDYLVRNLVGMDAARGWLAIGEPALEGGKIGFCRRDGESAKRDLEHMLARLKTRVRETPKGAVYYSCVARGPNLFGPGSAELGLLREVLGEVPLVGFFCNGEISNARLYGYTGVLALFL
jgi:small ligand-binding sensory domain FIST